MHVKQARKCTARVVVLDCVLTTWFSQQRALNLLTDPTENVSRIKARHKEIYIYTKRHRAIAALKPKGQTSPVVTKTHWYSSRPLPLPSNTNI